MGAQPHCKHLQTYCSPSAACCGQGAGRQLWYPLPTQTPQTACGCCVRPRVRGLAGPTHHVLSRACCFSCSSRFRLSTSTFSSIFCGEGGRWVGCPHSCPDPPVPLPTGMHQRWHGGPHHTARLRVLMALSGTGGILACWCWDRVYSVLG